MLLPPVAEASELVSEIKKKVSVYGMMLDKANEQIGLLKERRTALISSAVTGKIDVRNWQPPQQTSKEVAA